MIFKNNCIVFFLIVCNRAQNTGCLELTGSCGSFDKLKGQKRTLCKISSLHCGFSTAYMCSSRLADRKVMAVLEAGCPFLHRQWYLHKLRPLSHWIGQKKSLLLSMQINRLWIARFGFIVVMLRTVCCRTLCPSSTPHVLI